MGIEPASYPWQGHVITFIPYLRAGSFLAMGNDPLKTIRSFVGSDPTTGGHLATSSPQPESNQQPAHYKWAALPLSHEGRWTWGESNPCPKLILNMIVYAINWLENGNKIDARHTIVFDPQQLPSWSTCISGAELKQPFYKRNLRLYLEFFDGNAITRAQSYNS